MVGFTVDDFIARFNPPFPTHIKMDVDGLECRILQAATTTLRDPRLRSVIVELSLTDHQERNRAVELLDRCGLSYISSGYPQMTDTEIVANHLFGRFQD